MQVLVRCRVFSGSLLRPVVIRSRSSAGLSSHQPLLSAGMDLPAVLEVLERLAPLSLAESWDNVGLLVEPSQPRRVSSILLTNDLTAAVMDEAEALRCQLIVSYHPPVFRPLKRLLQSDWKQRLVLRAVEAGIAVFSPHTAWDSVRDGLSDWLVAGVGAGAVSVLKQAHSSGPQRHRLEFFCGTDADVQHVLEQLTHVEGAVVSEGGGQRVVLTCPSSALTAAAQILTRAHTSTSLNITQVQPPPLLGCGQGRISVLEQPVSISTAVQKMKTHLGLCHLRVALGEQHTLDSLVQTVAVCAGSGASVLQGVRADLFITGEMSHHEVLDAVSAGTSVILSEHSNSERGFLSVFRQRLSSALPEAVRVVVSERDRDPLQVF